MRFIQATLCLGLLVSGAEGEIIIDDFDDSAIVSGPIFNDVANVQTPSVGALNVERSIGIFSASAETYGQINSNVSSASHLTIEVTNIDRRSDTLSPLVLLGFNYELATETDLSEGGKNNALFFDFKSITGLTPPPMLRIWLFDDTVPGLSYVRFLSPVPTSADPFTLAVRFDTLQDRGGRGIPATFTHVYEANFTFFANEFYGAPDELGWRVELDRIRVGVIPEPTTLTMLLTGPLLIFPRRLR